MQSTQYVIRSAHHKKENICHVSTYALLLLYVWKLWFMLPSYYFHSSPLLEQKWQYLYCNSTCHCCYQIVCLWGMYFTLCCSQAEEQKTNILPLFIKEIVWDCSQFSPGHMLVSLHSLFILNTKNPGINQANNCLCKPDMPLSRAPWLSCLAWRDPS